MQWEGQNLAAKSKRGEVMSGWLKRVTPTPHCSRRPPSFSFSRLLTPAYTKKKYTGTAIMAVIDSLTFVIRAADQDNVRGRAVRRIFMSNPAMKLAKLFTGDVVILSAPSEISQEKVGLCLPSEMVCQIPFYI